MNKTQKAAVFFIVASLFAACSKTDAALPAASNLTPAVSDASSSQSAPSRELSASCIFTEGLVELGRSGSWVTVEIGDAIEAGDTVRTAPDASCELQFGRTAILKLQPSTTLVVNEIILSEAVSSVDASLDVGRLLNKVQKLAGTDSYIIRTETSVCGVRGTDFIISSDSKTGTTVAVQHGRVAVVTASPIIDNLLASSASNAVAAAAIQAIVAAAPIVESNEELSIDQKAVTQAEVVYKQIQVEVNSVPPVALSANAAAATVAPPLISFTAPDTVSASVMPASSSVESLAAVTRLIKKVDVSLKPQAKVPVAASKKTAELLKDLDSISPMPLSSTGAVTDPTTPVTMAITLPAAVSATPATPATPAAPETAITAPASAPSELAKKSAIAGTWPALKKAVAGGVVRVPSTGSFVVSDADGNLSSVSESGKTLWSVTTANKAADRSYAVPFKDRVYYSGSDEFLIIDAASGSVLFRVALEGNRSHMFGNRVVPFPNAIVFPTKDGLEVLSEKTGETVRVIPVSGGTNMTPANYEDLAAIVNQKGVFMLIDIQTGEIKAEIKTNAVQPVAQAPRIVGTRACFADRKGLLVMIDLASKSLAWEKSLSDSGGIFADVEMGSDGVFAFGKNKIFSFTLAGAEIMPVIADVSAPPLLSKGVLYYGTNDGFLVAFKLSSKKESGRIALGAKMTARPLFADGFIFAGTENGRIVKVDASLF